MKIKLIGGVLALVLAITAFILTNTPKVTDFKPRDLGGDFSAQSIDGEFLLSDFKGKLVTLYFGYTSCPDICPTSLNTMRFAFSELSDTQRANVQGLFVSVDPDRDSIEHLSTYAEFFSPNIIGATGTRQQIDQAVNNFGAYYRFIEQTDSAMGYTVDHSSKIYLIGTEGQLIKALPHSSSPSDLAELIKANLP